MAQKNIKTDVAIIVAGPAGLFAAHKLIASGLKITIIDRGKAPSERDGDRDIVYGVGGAGTFSDGKLNLIAEKIGGDLTVTGKSKSSIQKIIEKVDEIFTFFGAPLNYSGEDQEKLFELKQKAMQHGIELVAAKQRHIGTTHVRKVIDNFYKYLIDNDVLFSLENHIKQINKTKNGFILNGKNKIQTKYLIIAPGRAQSHWLRPEMQKLGISPQYGPIDIGVRVEIPYEVYEPIGKLMYDAKLRIVSSTDNLVRTFCTNPKGFVAREDHGDFFLVNGHADSERRTDLTNFALLCREPLTWPLSDTAHYGRLKAIDCNNLGGGKPIAQRLIDLERGHRSTPERIGKLMFEPTLKDITPGDIGLGLPYKTVRNLLEGIERLDKIMPGLRSPHTLLYAPEIKFYSDRYPVGKYMDTSIPGLFIAGDGSGHCEGIPQAAASGIIAAQGIIAIEI
jgi:uncharacterized FAD-dependent dehydrogenase